MTADPTLKMTDAEFARSIDGRAIPYWSHLWPRIGELQRKGLLRVKVLNRYMGEVHRA